jgi:hypothetical protein
VQPGYGEAIYVPEMAEWSVFYYFTFKVFLSQPPKTAFKKEGGGHCNFLKNKKSLARN